MSAPTQKGQNGTRHFWRQRVSAVGLILLGLWFACALSTMPGFSHAEALAFIGAPFNGVLLLLLVVTLAWHSYLGVQVVIEDYVHGHGLNHASLVISGVAHSFLAAAAIYAIIKIGLGA